MKKLKNLKKTTKVDFATYFGVIIAFAIVFSCQKMGLLSRSISGMLVALSSALCYDKKIVVLSVLGTYFGGMLVDQFTFGLNLKRKLCIISSKTDKIVDYILYDLHSGCSLYNVIGAYDKVTRPEIIVIVDKHEYRAIMDYVREVDPKAFITVYSVNEVSYQPKK